MKIVEVAVLAYGMGSIPFSLLVAMYHRVDLFKVGSGNLGATNVLRALGWKWGLLVFLLDALKGYIPTMLILSSSTNPWIHIGVGLLAVVGHSYSIFAKFKGGKGVATGIGILLALSPDVAVIVLGGALLGIALTRYVAPFSILGSVVTPVLLWVKNYADAYVVCTAIIAMMIIWRHKDNIKRLCTGQENRMSLWKK